MTEDELYRLPLGALIEKYPACRDFLKSYGLLALDASLPLPQALEKDLPDSFREMQLSASDLADLLVAFLTSDADADIRVSSLEIVGGSDKDGRPENISVTLCPGDVVSLAGPTGSGKSQLLADIECAARGDTPSRRRILFNGAEMADARRFSLGSRLVAQLTQNMNFVMDVSAEEFLEMHALSRMPAGAAPIVDRCFEMANRLSGERFRKDTRLTRLSGGQARALMIADTVMISPAPILLIDEIENAGIDRLEAMKLLTQGKKIVLLATHDPLLALSAGRRIILQNGGIRAVLEQDETDRENLKKLGEADRLNTSLRQAVRNGERNGKDVGTV